LVSSSSRAEDQPKAAEQPFPARVPNQADVLKAFDKNGDGTLDEQERKAMFESRKAAAENFRKAREKKFDVNGDGTLDEQERKAMIAEMQKRRANTAPRMQELFKRFDKDGNGTLSDEERKAMAEAHANLLQPKDGKAKDAQPAAAQPAAAQPAVPAT
jgi:Ca2+-binding EF-hand superfamily protein